MSIVLFIVFLWGGYNYLGRKYYEDLLYKAANVIQADELVISKQNDLIAKQNVLIGLLDAEVQKSGKDIRL